MPIAVPPRVDLLQAVFCRGLRGRHQHGRRRRDKVRLLVLDVEVRKVRLAVGIGVDTEERHHRNSLQATYRADVRDEFTAYQRDLEVVVVLQGGRQLDGLLRRYESVLEVEASTSTGGTQTTCSRRGSHLSPLGSSS
jgi:hypothetical protein